MITAKIIADSEWSGKRLITLQLRYPRFIHSEVMTHRVFSRSASSSRAVPIQKTIDQVMQEPAHPIHFGLNQAGMVAEKEADEAIQDCAMKLWLKARDEAVKVATQLAQLGIHKQVVNRILEPFQLIDVVVTATDWDNFFKLRLASDAQPEIHELAKQMKKAIDESTPEQTILHIPYVTAEERVQITQEYGNKAIEVLQRISAARCARVSYKNHDQSNPVIEKDLELADRLAAAMHCFTEGTEVLTSNGWIDFKDVTYDHEIAAFDVRTSEFKGYEQPTNVIANQYDGKIYEWDNPDLSIGVTDQHKLLGVLINKSEDRKKSYSHMSTIIPNEVKGNSVKTNGEREMIMFSAPKPYEPKNLNEFAKGKLIGFFLGDGFTSYNTSISFRLKKQRKIDYLTDLLQELGLEYKMKVSTDGVTNIKVKSFFNGKDYYNEEKRKYIPNLNLPLDVIAGIFDGLKNSDGSIKRNTWVYDTMSKQLCDQILQLCPLVGLTGRLSKANCYQHYRISFTTNNHIRLNDSRTKHSKVTIKDYSGIVRCVEIPSHGIMVRKDGKTMLTHNCSPFEHPARGQMPHTRYANFSGWESFRHSQGL